MPGNIARAARGSHALDVSVQLATRRPYVPHPRRLRRWAEYAYASCPPARGAKAAAASRPAELTIRVAGAAESRRLNRIWRGRDQPTNVLSFSAGDEPRRGSTAVLGDLLICAPVVAREAREQGKSREAHWAHMVVHGILHLMGYDHAGKPEALVMETREVEILAEFGYPDPYDRANSTE